MPFDPSKGFIECGFCHGRLQALKEYDYGLDTDADRLSEIAETHWAQCSAEEPWLDDPAATYP